MIDATLTHVHLATSHSGLNLTNEVLGFGCSVNSRGFMNLAVSEPFMG